MKKFYGIEILRFLTSISVLIYHYRHFFAPYNSTSNLSYFDINVTLPLYNFLGILYEHGIFGVHVFYTISGFVFAHIYLSTNKSVSSKNFFINRFGRLYPLHFATLILVSFLQLYSFIKFESFQIIQINDLYHFILNIFFISSWGFESGHSFNAPIWSVSVEVAIYIFFFVLLSFIRKHKMYFLIILSIALLAIDKAKIFDTLFLECARLFFSGSLIYYFFSMKFNHGMYFLLSVIFIFAAFLGNFKTFIFCPGLILFFVCLDKYIKNNSTQSLFRNLGNLTYSLYLIHLPIQILILIVFKLLNINEILFTNLYFFLLFFLFLIFLAFYCFKFYEKPLNELIRKKFSL